MSFGAAASRDTREGFVRVRPTDTCPCGSGTSYAACCARWHDGEAAPTAEALMRSRYSAFVVGDARYLRETWHPGTRPSDLDLTPRTRWTGLEIVATDGGLAGDRRGVVEFRASWREGSQRGVLHEHSRFAFQSGQWWYLDGRASGA